MFFYRLLHVDTPVLAKQQKLTFLVQTLYIIWKTYQKQWPIETDGERESTESVLLACFDDDDYYYLTGPTILNGPGSNSTEELLHIPQIWSLTIRCSLGSYPEYIKICPLGIFNEYVYQVIKFISLRELNH